MPTDDETKLVLDALENPKYTWRTIRGISTETGLNPEIVKSNISANSDVIIKSSSHNQKGEELFATREKYRDKVSPLTRLGSALKNRSS